MDDKLNMEVKSDITEQMAQDMSVSTMSRRERRRLAQAKPVIEEVVPPTPSLFEQPAVDEPTKKYTVVSKRAVEEAPVFEIPKQEPVKREYFSFDDASEQPVRREPEAAPKDVEEVEEKEKEEPKAPVKEKESRFSRKQAEKDDDDDEYDRPVDEDDEDEDDDDDDEENRPFGYHVINFFKGLFELVLVLLVLVLLLNVLDFFNVVPLDKLYNRYHDKAPVVLDTLFPSHKLKITGGLETETPEQSFTPIEAIQPVEEATEQVATGDDFVDVETPAEEGADDAEAAIE